MYATYECEIGNVIAAFEQILETCSNRSFLNTGAFVRNDDVLSVDVAITSDAAFIVSTDTNGKLTAAPVQNSILHVRSHLLESMPVDASLGDRMLVNPFST